MIQILWNGWVTENKEENKISRRERLRQLRKGCYRTRLQSVKYKWKDVKNRILKKWDGLEIRKSSTNRY